MFAKLLVTIAAAAVIGGVLLDLRHSRLEAMHEMTRLHRQMDLARQQTWDLQIRIAEQLEPESLRQAIERAQLALEPAALPGPVSVPPRQLIAEQNHGR